MTQKIRNRQRCCDNTAVFLYLCTMKHILHAIWLSALLSACGQSSDTTEAQRLLAEARTMFAQHRYDDARHAIKTIRRQYPRAISQRQQALLLLDSIEIQAASDTLMNPPLGCDTEELRLRISFHQRSLEELQKKQISNTSK